MGSKPSENGQKEGINLPAVRLYIYRAVTDKAEEPGMSAFPESGRGDQCERVH